MSRVVALRVVERPASFRREFDYLQGSSSEGAHSLHYGFQFPHSFSPEFASFFISRYSQRGDVVLDPFCGAGSTSLEAALLGRISFSSDRDPLAVLATSAKLAPSDLTEVTLKLQHINLRRPVQLDEFNQVFAPFYDVETYRELLNLKHFVSLHSDRTTRFLSMLALSLLHGNNAGYFSAYTWPHYSLTPEEQQQINFKRGQSPDYRPLMPRLLRKAAFVFRDGIPSVLHHLAPHHRLCESDARNLGHVPSGSVQLVVTAPPLPGEASHLSGQWMRYWFAALSNRVKGLELFADDSLDAWIDFMHELLTELARAVRGGGRVVLDLREVKLGGAVYQLEEQVIEVVQEHLARYWDVEGVFLQRQRYAKVRDCAGDRDPARLARRSRALVLRRK